MKPISASASNDRRRLLVQPLPPRLANESSQCPRLPATRLLAVKFGRPDAGNAGLVLLAFNHVVPFLVASYSGARVRADCSEVDAKTPGRPDRAKEGVL